jgi:hypothetical protein
MSVQLKIEHTGELEAGGTWRPHLNRAQHRACCLCACIRHQFWTAYMCLPCASSGHYCCHPEAGVLVEVPDMNERDIPGGLYPSAATSLSPDQCGRQVKAQYRRRIRWLERAQLAVDNRWWAPADQQEADHSRLRQHLERLWRQGARGYRFHCSKGSLQGRICGPRRFPTSDV